MSDHFLMYVIALCCIYECVILTLEYKYDADKDAKKSRRSRTTKKTTTAPTGEIVVEEHTETTESKGNGNDKA